MVGARLGDERPRERLASRGPGGLGAAELIAIVWGSGVRGTSAVDLAERALERHDGLTGLARASASELTALPGVGAARAAQLAAAFELGRRLLADWPTGRWIVRSPGDLADRLILQMGRLEREELRVVLLNTKNAVLKVVPVYVGNVSASLVRVGELFRDAVRENATSVILVHNHPSGDPTTLRNLPGKPPLGCATLLSSQTATLTVRSPDSVRGEPRSARCRCERPTRQPTDRPAPLTPTGW